MPTKKELEEKIKELEEDNEMYLDNIFMYEEFMNDMFDELMGNGVMYFGDIGKKEDDDEEYKYIPEYWYNEEKDCWFRNFYHCETDELMNDYVLVCDWANSYDSDEKDSEEDLENKK